ncbi:hypothetical protein H5410_014459 [Solanum commersonii]|uniref:Uncharacterized protein n=1 Tax=Solanum commersonii TaxID=4109 RepID=A0A9J5ZRA8_SOLCO|nr:hypothetical protein H5410_014459 [Solanum commersonii]
MGLVETIPVRALQLFVLWMVLRIVTQLSKKLEKDIYSVVVTFVALDKVGTSSLQSRIIVSGG